MTFEIRSIQEGELDAYTAQLTRTFGGSRPTEAQLEATRRNVEIDRATAAYDDGRMVASAGVHSFRMTVPGGAAVACAGVTRVSVLPTHRRRGILRRLMRQQLDDVRRRGEPIAALYASQAPIYGRFGYGPATWHAHVELARGRSALRSAPPELHLRFVERDEAIRIATEVHNRVAAGRAGAAHRSATYWEDRLHDPPERRTGASELNCVVAETDGGVEGFLSYRLIRRFVPTERGTVRVGDLLATTTAAYLDLWRFCTSIDLMTRIEAPDRPADEPFRMALADPRALEVSVADGIWLRLVDVGAALEARRYAKPGRLVLHVRDEFCGWNDGTYALDVGPDGTGSCRRTESAADVELEVGDLAAGYLGGTRFVSLAGAGRVAGSAQAVDLADAMFLSDQTPWCPTHF